LGADVIHVCESCGNTIKCEREVAEVKVRHRRTGERRRMTLCPRCLSKLGQAWRLVWEPVEVEVER
jgi:adenine-specific DNA methylase